MSTNFFANTSWGHEIPPPTDPATWEGVTRRNNLLNLTSKLTEIDLDAMKGLMQVDINDGGGFWNMTIYQIIFQPQNNHISLRRSYTEKKEWVDINLNDFYQ